MISQFSLIGLSILMLMACSGTGSSTLSEDERERSIDWEATIELTLKQQEGNPGFEHIKVVDWSSSRSLDELAEQLFEMGFSGDALIHPPTLFGEIDEERELAPEELVKELSLFDSVSVVDINTGLLKDTIVDMSFTRTVMSSLIFGITVDDPAGQFYSNYIAIGNQVFNEETGERRGVSNKFFISNRDISSPIPASYRDEFVLYTDSLGRFVPHAFEIHEEISPQGVSSWLETVDQESLMFKLTFKIQLSASTGTYYIEDLNVVPLKGAEIAV